MHPGGLCPERERLLRAVTAAVNAHAHDVGLLSQAADVHNSERFRDLSIRAKGSFAQASAAMDAYRQHLEKHGCG